MNAIKRKKNDYLFPSIFDDFFTPDWFGGAVSQKRLSADVPAVNIKETDTGFHIEMAVPGKRKEDFNLELEEDILTISSESKKEQEEKDEKGQYTRREFSYSSFKRAFTLPDTVDAEGINARYEEGILKIDLPKKDGASSNTKRLIDIA